MSFIDESAKGRFGEDDPIVSRSFSSGMNQPPNISSNRLRVYSTDTKCTGPLRVRSSPSSPNRLSRFQCMPVVHKKWSAINKINQSSSSELDSYNSIRSLQCDSNFEPLDIFLRHDSSNFSLTHRPKSCQSLQTKDLSTTNEDYLYSFSGDTEGIPRDVDVEELKDHLKSNSRTLPESREHYDKLSSHSPFYKESLLISNKTFSNPINFKKVLRDRYLNSQRSSNIGLFSTYTPTSSPKISTSKSLTDDWLYYHTNHILPEGEDHNFNFLEESDSRRSVNIDSYTNSLIDQEDYKKSLSIDLMKFSALKKYRILSNNSTISSMSGIEAEGDPFSPALTEICSPFLKLNLPYQVNQKQLSECGTPNLITCSSLGTLPLTHETENHSPFKSVKCLSTQRFFPESMKLSDFNINQSCKSDCQLNSSIKEQLMLPGVVNSSKSAPQSLQLSPKCNNLLLGSFNSNLCQNINRNENIPKKNMLYSDKDISFGRSLTNSKSMDALNSWNINTKCVTSKNTKGNQNDWMKNNELKIKAYDGIILPNIKLKSKVLSVNQMTKKSTSSCSSSSQRQCTVCGRHFNRSDMLARHSRVHTGHKPFECSICGQSFSRSDHLNTHMRIHSGEKPYRCSLCSYSACRRDMITRHLRVHRRKGDVSTDSVSVLVVNTQKTLVNHHKYTSVIKSHKPPNLDVGSASDDGDVVTLHRSHSFTDSNQSYTFTEQNSLLQSTESNTTVPSTFANISISICQPTPRSSFSMPMESSQHDS